MAEIVNDMDFDDWSKAWLDLCRVKGHVLVEDSSGVDLFVTSGGQCNGPGCTKCGWTTCMHCDWRGERIPQCSATDAALHPHYRTEK